MNNSFLLTWKIFLFVQKPENDRKEFNSSKLDQNISEKIPENTEFSIPSVSVSFIETQLNNLKVNKATGIDEISAKFLKLASPNGTAVIEMG